MKLTKFVGVIMIICLLPFIAMIGLDIIKITLALIPAWIWVVLIVAGVLLVVSMVAKFLPKRHHHRHDHFFH